MDKMKGRMMPFLLACCLALTILLPAGTVTAAESAETEEPIAYTAERQAVAVSGETSAEPEEDLFYQYMLQLAREQDEDSVSLFDSDTAGSHLTGYEKKAYDSLSKQILEVANGEKTDTRFEVTLEDLGLDPEAHYDLTFFTENYGEDVDWLYDSEQGWNADAIDALYDYIYFDDESVFVALRYDLPYAEYWYNKTQGIATGYPGYNGGGSENDPYLCFTSGYTFTFAVSQEYADGTYVTIEFDGGVTRDYLCQVDSKALINFKVTDAVAAAKKIVDDYADFSDYDKLVAYRRYICDAVSYNNAANENKNTPYGNPWQLIYVFDDDDSTNVVCEGYAKAFQYLCDLSTFTANQDADGTNDIISYIVTGYMIGGTGEGPHMWNIVHMDDGKYYIVDVTNCDEGTEGDEDDKPSVGAPDYLFLVGATAKDGSDEADYTSLSADYIVGFMYTVNIPRRDAVGGGYYPETSISYMYDYGTYDVWHSEIPDTNPELSVIFNLSANSYTPKETGDDEALLELKTVSFNSTDATITIDYPVTQTKTTPLTFVVAVYDTDGKMINLGVSDKTEIGRYTSSVPVTMNNAVAVGESGSVEVQVIALDESYKPFCAALNMGMSWKTDDDGTTITTTTTETVSNGNSTTTHTSTTTDSDGTTTTETGGGTTTDNGGNTGGGTTTTETGGNTLGENTTTEDDNNGDEEPSTPVAPSEPSGPSRPTTPPTPAG